ncbi:MAG: hypothetical protein JW709_11100 [Sedimentisphaerales bacterium]|nr:hypothetical protein [Sedimentisphaerales bacterium]
MSAVRACWVSVSLVLVMLSATRGRAAEIIGANCNDSSIIAFDGVTSVWSYTVPNKNIYGYSFATESPFTVSDHAAVQEEPDVDGQRIVWADNRDGTYAIYGMNLVTMTTECLYDEESSDQQTPAISGDVIVWRDNRNSATTGYDIYAYNLASEILIPVCTDSGTQYQPDIDGDVVVWKNATDNGIYGYRLSNPGVFPICVDGIIKDFPRISGNWVVWREGAGKDIYGIDITTLPAGAKKPICTLTSTQTTPAIHNNLVVWVDERNGNKDIYGYDLLQEREFYVSRLAGNETYPAVHDGRFIWQCGGSIYTTTYDDLPHITVMAPNGGEMFAADTTTTITWSSSEVDTVNVAWSANNGSSWTYLANNIPNTGSLEWEIPAGTDSTLCRVKVEDYDHGDIDDMSNDAFTVFICSPSLTGDANGDCFVNLLDLAALCSQWLSGGNPYDPGWIPN